MNLAAATPHNELASTKYCLAHSGEEYLVYLPEGDEVTVDLSSAPGEFAKWVHRLRERLPREEQSKGEPSPTSRFRLQSAIRNPQFKDSEVLK